MRRRLAARSCSMARVTRSCDGRTGRSSKRSTSSCEAPTRRRCETRSAPEGGELSRLLPDLAQRVGELPPPVAADPDTERHRLHTAVARPARRRRARAPLVVVIEDGHWADTPTLLLLRHLARGASDARALLVTTFRDTEAEVPEALSAALVDLRRSEGVVRMRLGGLSAEEISEFVRARGRRRLRSGSAGARSSPERADGRQRVPDDRAVAHAARERDRLGRTTAGRGWRVPMADLGSPEGVREVVSQRLARLEHRHDDAAGAGRRRRTGVRPVRDRAVSGWPTRSCTRRSSRRSPTA